MVISIIMLYYLFISLNKVPFCPLGSILSMRSLTCKTGILLDKQDIISKIIRGI